MIRRMVGRLLGLIIDTAVGYRKQHLAAVIEMDRTRKVKR